MKNIQINDFFLEESVCPVVETVELPYVVEDLGEENALVSMESDVVDIPDVKVLIFVDVNSMFLIQLMLNDDAKEQKRE
jgi:hypothetical protein